MKTVSEIGIGHYDPGDRESFVTLNINYFTPKMRKVRHMIGFWLHPTLKEKVFCEMKEFAEKHHLSMVFQRY